MVRARYKSRTMPSVALRTSEQVVALEDQAATEALATRLARVAAAGDVLALRGDLGAGKTTFARAFIRARTGAAEVPSPTFTLVQVYHAADGVPVWHVDLFRIRDSAEAEELGLEEATAAAIILIEWPERLTSLPPGARVEIRLAPGPRATARVAIVTDRGGWAARMAGLFADV